MRVSAPLHQELVLLGGGHAHAAVLKRFGMRPEPGVRLTLISESVMTPYSGMIPGYLAGRFSYEEAHLDLRKLAQFADGDFVEIRATGLDLENRRVLLPGRPPIRFDVLSVDTGSTPDLSGVSGAQTYGIPVKPISEFLARWQAFESTVVNGPERVYQVLVAGAGAGGVEVLLSLQWRLQRQLEALGGGRVVEFSLVGAGSEPMPNHNPRVRRAFARILAERGIRAYWNRRVVAALEGGVTLDDGREIACDRAVFVTGASAPSWVAESGLRTDERGFLEIDQYLASTSHPFVFAAGDVAASRPYPRPKSGVFAVRQGLPLERNLRLALRGLAPRPFRPQAAFLSLVSTGDPYAVASKGRFKLEGKWVWDWKERIDRRWMRGYQQLPQMGTMVESSHPKGAPPVMRCAGCGSKVSSSALRGALERLAADGRTPQGWAPEDAAELEVVDAAAIWQSVDFLPSFLNDPYRFGRIAAIHALNDLYAMGAAPTSAQILAQTPYATPRLAQESLYQMLAGAVDLLSEDGVRLLGGHSSEGVQPGLGFVVNGRVASGAVWRKGTLRVGDGLLLTQPLGTGILFAAAMRGAAPGSAVSATVEVLGRSRRRVFAALCAAAPHAVTDVTGFGFVGHALEMARASGVSLRIHPPSIPVFEAVEGLIAAGYESSLAPENRAEFVGLEALHGVSSADQSLWVDPQTAGGFLVGAPTNRLQRLESRLREDGWQAAIIGEVVDSQGAPVLSVRSR